ncbi:hypothetical protein JVU11DRAFT_4508 [Chiua virens]|nr:hypothetical protein JVU11DRAFT_4508 [Chiua virens]
MGNSVACPVEREITLWDTVTHAMVDSPIRYTGRIKSIAISPDDTLLATGQDDDQITLQNLRDVLPPSYFVMPATPASERPQLDTNTRYNAVIPLMQISELGFESWIHGRLGNAESVFTQEITRSSGDHHALANRAFIRVRSERWKEAFNDAEESIKIQPSAIAFIAKSMALVGNGKIADGYRSCDLAFTHSDPNDIYLLHAIKSIIFCMAEDYEEAISHLSCEIRIVD